MKPSTDIEVQDLQSKADGDPITVFFDGSCALCSLEIKHYSANSTDGEIAFVDVSAAQADPCPGVSAEAAMKRFHIRLGDGTVVSGARAFVAIWKELPFWRHVAKVGQVPGAIILMECIYRLFLPIRPVLSRLVRLLGFKPANPPVLKR